MVMWGWVYVIVAYIFSLVMFRLFLLGCSGDGVVGLSSFAGWTIYVFGVVGVDGWMDGCT